MMKVKGLQTLHPDRDWAPWSIIEVDRSNEGKAVDKSTKDGCFDKLDLYSEEIGYQSIHSVWSGSWLCISRTCKSRNVMKKLIILNSGNFSMQIRWWKPVVMKSWCSSQSSPTMILDHSFRGGVTWIIESIIDASLERFKLFEGCIQLRKKILHT